MERVRKKGNHIKDKVSINFETKPTLLWPWIVCSVYSIDSYGIPKNDVREQRKKKKRRPWWYSMTTPFIHDYADSMRAVNKDR